MIDGFTFGMGVALVSLVVWAVRLESKTNTTAADTVDLKLKLERHERDQDIHHNASAFGEFEKRIDERFVHLNQSIDKVEKFVEDIDRKFEEFINRP